MKNKGEISYLSELIYSRKILDTRNEIKEKQGKNFEKKVLKT